MLEPDSEDRLLRIGLYEIESKLDLIDTKLAAIPDARRPDPRRTFGPSYHAVFVLFGIEFLAGRIDRPLAPSWGSAVRPSGQCIPLVSRGSLC
jgi:hypothetical protein